MEGEGEAEAGGEEEAAEGDEEGREGRHALGDEDLVGLAEPPAPVLSPPIVEEAVEGRRAHVDEEDGREGQGEAEGIEPPGRPNAKSSGRREGGNGHELGPASPRSLGAG